MTWAETWGDIGISELNIWPVETYADNTLALWMSDPDLLLFYSMKTILIQEASVSCVKVTLKIVCEMQRC